MSTPRRHLLLTLPGLCAVLLAGCGGPVHRDSAPEGYPDFSHTPDAVPRVERTNPANQRSYTVFGRTYHPMKSAYGFREQGVASWYGKKFHGNKTANGETYDMYAMSAAHTRLPLPTYVEVRNLENNRKIVVRVNDRGPFHGNRIIDLSYAAASKLGMTQKGTALVEVRAIDPRNPTAHRQERKLAAAGPKGGKGTPEGKAVAVRKAPRIYIQVGAFGDPNNARRLQQRLEQHLQRAVRIENGGHVHRVQIGPLVSVETADLIVDRLEDIRIYETQMLLR